MLYHTVQSTVEGQIVQRSEKLQLTTYSPAGKRGGALLLYTSQTHLFIAAEFLQSRSWQGLEQQLGKTVVSEAVEGRQGTASGYSHENDT